VFGVLPTEILPRDPLPAPGPISPRARIGARRVRSSPDDRRRRRGSHAFGLEAEASVGRFLRAGGYELLARRKRLGQAEIDLVVERSGVLAFVEVKARRRGVDGYYAVDRRKQARMTGAADVWLMEHPEHRDHVIRFDVALVWPGGGLDYVENAFDAHSVDDFVF
jgi:putative endonuclease